MRTVSVYQFMSDCRSEGGVIKADCTNMYITTRSLAYKLGKGIKIYLKL